MKPVEMVGRVFGKMTVLERVDNYNKKLRYLCRCECGREAIAWGTHLRRGQVTTCGCSRRRTGSDHPCWNGHGDISGHTWNQICRNGLKSNRKTREGIAFEITIEEAWDLFVGQAGQCRLSGVRLSFGEGSKGVGRTASLDRISSAGGYTLDNVQWVHKDINWMKNTFDQGYFIEQCKRVAARNP